MEVKKYTEQSGDLYISTGVIEKISKLASLEIDGVANVSTGSSGVKGMFAKTNLPKSVEVNMVDEIAEITVHVIVKYGYKAETVAKAVQEAVKTNVQNMTNITVSKVNIIIAGIQAISQDQ